LQKKFAVILFCGNLFLQIVKKIAKLRTRKNLVPHCTSFIQSTFNSSNYEATAGLNTDNILTGLMLEISNG